MTYHSTRPVIVWFRDDLRLADHPALSAAAGTGAPVICLFVLDEEGRTETFRPLGAASRWWLAQSLRALDKDLRKLGLQLVLRRGPPAHVIAALAAETKAHAVFWNRVHIASELAVAKELTARLASKNIAAHECRSDLLADPRQIRGKGGKGLRVFTPFWRRVISLGAPAAPLPAPTRLPAGPAVSSEQLDDWKLEPRTPDWASGLRETWSAGEAAARATLESFLKGRLAAYCEMRDRPGHKATSSLSPHLRFGAISPRQVWHAARFAGDREPRLRADIDKFLSELGWREFARHVLFDEPALAKQNLQPGFDAFPWINDDKSLRAWQRGRTGYPIVDAGMRELWKTGVMHNRVRMVAASFLVKHLLMDWRLGERWFWDTLIDADPGSNPFNWQWVAGSGADAAPYFRIFNPVLQGEKFDPDGVYVRRWIPELAPLSNRFVHKPWAASPVDLAAAGIVLGKDYPEPVIDHGVARERALAAYASTRR